MTGRPGVAGIEITSGATTDGRGFCTVNISLTNGAGHQGQLSPDEVRTMALDWLQAAEAAETDAALIGWAQDDLALDENRIGAMLTAFRHQRDEVRSRTIAKEAARLLKRQARPHPGTENHRGWR